MIVQLKWVINDCQLKVVVNHSGQEQVMHDCQPEIDRLAI